MTGLEIFYYILACVGAGAAAGFLSGLFGIGGGVVTVPIFVFLFRQFDLVSYDVLMHVATATSLALVVPASFVSSWKHLRVSNLDLRYFRSWIPAVIVGVIIGIIILPFLHTRFLQSLYIALVLTIALYLFFYRQSWTLSQYPPGKWGRWIAGLPLGGLSVLLGIGGGPFTTGVMEACRYPMRKAIAISSATSLVVGFVGAVGDIFTGWHVTGTPHFSLGYIDLIAFLSMTPVVMLFAPVGVLVEQRTPRRRLKPIYGAFLFLMALYMLVITLVG